MEVTPRGAIRGVDRNGRGPHGAVELVSVGRSVRRGPRDLSAPRARRRRRWPEESPLTSPAHRTARSVQDNVSTRLVMLDAVEPGRTPLARLRVPPPRPPAGQDRITRGCVAPRWLRCPVNVTRPPVDGRRRPGAAATRAAGEAPRDSCALPHHAEHAPAVHRRALSVPDAVVRPAARPHVRRGAETSFAPGNSHLPDCALGEGVEVRFDCHKRGAVPGVPRCPCDNRKRS